MNRTMKRELNVATPRGDAAACIARPRRGFTLAELLVVIAIIALLVAILLPAIAAVVGKSREAKTASIMRQFAAACELFEQDHGFYPGVVPEEELADNPLISGMENALMHLMGGYIRNDDPLWGTDPDYFGGNLDLGGGGNEPSVWVFEVGFGGGTIIRYRPGLLGNGPRIGGKQYQPYLKGDGGDVGLAKGTVGPGVDFPDLLDTWGTPIIYVRRMRTIGPLVDITGNRPQFSGGSMAPYITSMALGDLGANQRDVNGDGDPNESYSVFNASGASSGNPTISMADWNLQTTLANQAFAETIAGITYFRAARGSFVIISAGSDGVYFSATDGGGSINDGEDEIAAPATVSRFDDIVEVGGAS